MITEYIVANVIGIFYPWPAEGIGRQHGMVHHSFYTTYHITPCYFSRLINPIVLMTLHFRDNFLPGTFISDAASRWTCIQ